MKAVNLIPPDARRRGFGGGGGGGLGGAGASYAVIAILVVILLLVTVAVLTSNTIDHRKAELALLQQQAASTEAIANRLQPYVTFAQLAEARTASVKEIAAARFDWKTALIDLAKVVPANTSLSSVNATVAPGAGSGGGTSGGASLRGDISVPAFELAGCTQTQDDVAALVSHLRVIPGVTRVSFEDSTKGGTGSSGTTVSSSTTGSTARQSTGCSAGAPAFDLVVFFSPLPSAGPAGVVSVSATSTTSTTP